MANQVSTTNVEFITAEELKRLAELDAESDYRHSPASMLDEINTAMDGIEDFMKIWVSKYPSEAMKIKARLVLAQKEGATSQKIFIGLPRTELDD